ncbi:hypothetical protein ZIOFF_028575 [Zingiber officinale]|uniref:MYB-CC type transcription factor LHEQLE-containing domain-containing protein n=1 Tax=Zingiber officinale TaxID=94328 RepID=A0A8J5L3N3_ZINOF|nr:hypothetical protein ZIOFF_028575 [Zingiber officinale]
MDNLFIEYSSEDMLMSGVEDSFGDQETIPIDPSQTAQMGHIRDDIASHMWNDYVEHHPSPPPLVIKVTSSLVEMIQLVTSYFRGIDLTEALQLQMEVQKRLHEQLQTDTSINSKGAESSKQTATKRKMPELDPSNPNRGKPKTRVGDRGRWLKPFLEFHLLLISARALPPPQSSCDLALTPRFEARGAIAEPIPILSSIRCRVFVFPDPCPKNTNAEALAAVRYEPPPHCRQRCQAPLHSAVGLPSALVPAVTTVPADAAISRPQRQPSPLDCALVLLLVGTRVPPPMFSRALALSPTTRVDPAPPCDIADHRLLFSGFVEPSSSLV